MHLSDMNINALRTFKSEQEKKYEDFRAKGLKLDMSRGKPSPEQLELSAAMLDIPSTELRQSADGTDARNYAGVDGIPEIKRLFAELLSVDEQGIVVGGNSSLNLMYTIVSLCMSHGAGGCTPWGKGKPKFLCPAPGYDRHFFICEFLGIEMIPVKMTADGPDMNFIEEQVAKDSDIKGVWCVPKYSNPEGIVYSDETVRRFAALKPAAKDFRIFWDNAYFVHHLTDERPEILNIVEECAKAGNPDMVYMFASTSKISFAGAGLAVCATSAANAAALKKQLGIQTICFDKINQLRHAKFFPNAESVYRHMEKHRAILAPKFDIVLSGLENTLSPLGIGNWHKPLGGYFVSFDAPRGCAKRIVELCKEGGVVLTGAGATFPYGKDENDSNIRIAPTYPSCGELSAAMELFCICTCLAAAEKRIEALT